ncbi:MAG: hypothetical protein V4557_08035 [Bacteroidota bacterium]
MNPVEYIIQILDNPQLFILFPFVLFFLLLINKIIFKRAINGLLMLVFTSAIVFSIIFDFYLNKQIDGYKLIFFGISEGLIYFFVIFLYKRIITSLDKKKIFKILEILNDRLFSLIIFILLIQIVVNLINVDWGGSSRIAFQQNRWYSIVRMFAQLTNPVVAMLIFFNARGKEIKKTFWLLFLVICLFITSGSKSGFVFYLIEYYLIYRDIVFDDRKISKNKSASIISIVVIAAFFNFYLLGVDYAKIFERLVHYAEATIMVYPASDPCVACKGQSLISLIHRGVGRIINDPSSVDINTLFGFSLSAEFYGENTFTGPNARIGSYALCAFPGGRIVILYCVLMIFLGFNFLLLKISKLEANFIYISAILLVFHAIQHFIFDYNAAMADLSLIILVLFFLICKFVVKRRIFTKSGNPYLSEI